MKKKKTKYIKTQIQIKIGLPNYGRPTVNTQQRPIVAITRKSKFTKYTNTQIQNI